MSTPPTWSTPSSSLCAVVDHSSGTSAPVSVGECSQAGGRVLMSACSAPASWALIGSHPLGRAHAEELQPVGEDHPGGVDEDEPCPMQVRRVLVALGQHPAGVVEA